MTVTGVLLVAAGTFAFVFVGCLAAEMRDRANRDRPAFDDGPTAPCRSAKVRHHVRRHYYRLAVRLLAPLAALIDNLTAPARGVTA